MIESNILVVADNWPQKGNPRCQGSLTRPAGSATHKQESRKRRSQPTLIQNKTLPSSYPLLLNGRHRLWCFGCVSCEGAMGLKHFPDKDFRLSSQCLKMMRHFGKKTERRTDGRAAFFFVLTPLSWKKLKKKRKKKKGCLLPVTQIVTMES